MKKEKNPELKLEIIGNKSKYEKYKANKIPKSQQNRFILERKIVTKDYTPLSDILLNFKDDNKYFISKTRRIGRYNPNSKVTKKELIIDTRNELVQTHTSNFSDSKRKLKYSQLSNKNYSPKNKTKKVYPNKIIKLKPYSTEYTFPNNYYNTNIKPYNFNLNIDFNNSHDVKNLLYSIYPMKKNKFMKEYYKLKNKEKNWNYFPKLRQRQFIMDQTPMANFYSRKKEVKTFISPKDSPLPYISILSDDYLISEKLRFQNMMQKLTKLKSCIENNPKREYDIVKEFLLNNKLFEIDNFQTSKLKNFVHFIKGDFLLDPAKNFKENIMDILIGNEIEKPQLSYKLKNKKKAYFRNELLKQNIKNLEINSQTNSREDNDNCIVKNLNRYPQKIINETKDDSNAISPKKQEKHIKNKTDNEYNMSPIYSKPKSKGEIIERLLTKKYHEVEKFHYSPNLTEKEKEIVKNFKRLPLNLRRQKEIYSSCFENLDLDNNPKIIIELVEKKFKDEEKENEDLRAKTVANWNKVIKIKNEKLYGVKKNNSDYEELKKRNMLTEYICLMKAKNKFEINKLHEKYKI